MLITMPPRNITKTGLSIRVIYTRAEIEAGNAFTSLRPLLPLIDNASTVLESEGLLRLVIRGYEDDPRALCEIPEVRRWFANLTDRFPYWLHFCERAGKTLFMVLSLLAVESVEHRVSDNRSVVRLDPEEVGCVANRLLFQTDALYQQLGIPWAVNERLTSAMHDSLQKSFA